MKLLLIFLVLILTGIYLNRSYAYFYNSIGEKRLVSPLHETTMMVGSKPEGPTITYLSLGDSLTSGVGVSDYKNSYPYLIAKKMSLKNNVRLINLAHQGDTSADLIVNQLPKALSFNPDFITVLIGVNDIHNLKSLKEFEDNYTRIVEALKKSNAKIYILSIPYLGSGKIVSFPYNLILDFRTRQFNGVIKKISDKYQVKYIDLYFAPKPERFYSQDQFHPSGEGYILWRDLINGD